MNLQQCEFCHSVAVFTIAANYPIAEGNVCALHLGDWLRQDQDLKEGGPIREWRVMPR